MTRDEILTELRTSLHEMFEIEPTQIVEDARLREDLDLDSIDAIDLAVRLKDLLGRRVELTKLRELVTVGDVITLVENEASRASHPPEQTASTTVLG